MDCRVEVPDLYGEFGLFVVFDEFEGELDGYESGKDVRKLFNQKGEISKRMLYLHPGRIVI